MTEKYLQQNSWNATGKITKISKSNDKDLWVVYITISHKAPKYENKIAVPVCFVCKFDPSGIANVGDRIKVRGVFVPSNNKKINYNLMALNMHKVEYALKESSGAEAAQG